MSHLIEFTAAFTADLEVSPRQRLERLRVQHGARAYVGLRSYVQESAGGPVEVRPPGRVVAEDAQPACQAAEHRVDGESEGRVHAARSLVGAGAFATASPSARTAPKGSRAPRAATTTARIAAGRLPSRARTASNTSRSVS